MNIITTTTTTMEQIRKKEKENVYQKAYAKINLILEVYGKRLDGFHEIRTIFSEIDLFDELFFVLTKNRGVKIWSYPNFIDSENNIISRISLFLKDKYSVKDGAEISLKKNIPIAAGLAGGSSDAASTIVGLNKLWNLNMTFDEMNEVAKKFGSDINFFLLGGSAVGCGRGEQISPYKDIEIENIVLVKPNFGIASQKAYQIVSPRKKPNKNWELFSDSQDIRYCYNDLEGNIVEKFPKLKNIFEEIKKFGCKPMLSGSGSTVISFCGNLDTAKKVENYFTNKNYWTYITKTIRRQK